MAMPASGCIALRTCITGCACSSISCAVNGSVAGDCCLSLLSTTAGKSVPHCMGEFYGYTSEFNVDMDVYYEDGGGGECMAGCASLRCCTGTEYCYCCIDSNTNVSFTWTNIPSGCYYVDISDVLAYLAGEPILTTTYYWSDNYDSGSGACNNCFGDNNAVCFDVFDA